MAAYLGRYQQGVELPLVLQCVDADGAPEDPLFDPVVSIYRDGEPPVVVQTLPLAADLRGVATGLFRLPVFLNHLYTTAGRYLVVFRWQDQAGGAHSIPGAFMLLPGGSPDGAVLALKYVQRPDARYLIFQCDSGQLVRGRNPR